MWEGDNLRLQEDVRNAANDPNTWAHPALPASFQPFKSVLQSTYGVKACDPGQEALVQDRATTDTYPERGLVAAPGAQFPHLKKHTTWLHHQGQAQAGDHIGESFKTWKSPRRARQVTLCFLYSPPLSVHLVKPHQSKQGCRRQSTITEPETHVKKSSCSFQPQWHCRGQRQGSPLCRPNSWPAES